MKLSKFEDLPEEVALKIFSHMDLGDIAQLSKTAKLFNDYIMPQYQLLLCGPKTTEDTRFTTVSQADCTALRQTLLGPEARFIKYAVVNLAGVDYEHSDLHDLVLKLPNIEFLAIYSSTNAKQCVTHLERNVDFNKLKCVRFATAQHGIHDLLQGVSWKPIKWLTRLTLSLYGPFHWSDFAKELDRGLHVVETHTKSTTALTTRIKTNPVYLNHKAEESKTVADAPVVKKSSLRFHNTQARDSDIADDLHIAESDSRDDGQCAFYVKRGEGFESVHKVG